MDNSVDDIQLMQRFQDGEESSFELLVERHKDRIFAVACRFLGNSTEAEDVTQEIFIKVYHSRDSYKPTAKFTTWLYAICKNTCLKVLRSKRQPMISIDNNRDLDDGSVPAQFADPKACSPIDSIKDAEQALAIKKALDLLPPNQRMAVILSRYDELSYEDIAQSMKCSVKAVKSLLHRAKLQLKDSLKYYVKE